MVFCWYIEYDFIFMELNMVDFCCIIVGIILLNFFWLVFVLLIDKVYNVNCVFEVGWGGVVWKMFGFDLYVVNVSLCYGVV